MKDVAYYGLFLLCLVGLELAEDYRAERCIGHGGKWITMPGCKSDRCDYSKAGAK